MINSTLKITPYDILVKGDYITFGTLRAISHEETYDMNVEIILFLNKYINSQIVLSKEIKEKLSTNLKLYLDNISISGVFHFLFVSGVVVEDITRSFSGKYSYKYYYPYLNETYDNKEHLSYVEYYKGEKSSVIEINRDQLLEPGVDISNKNSSKQIINFLIADCQILETTYFYSLVQTLILTRNTINGAPISSLISWLVIVSWIVIILTLASLL